MGAAMTVMAALVGAARRRVGVELSDLGNPAGRYGSDSPDMPAVGGHGWRHGVVRYPGGEALVSIDSRAFFVA